MSRFIDACRRLGDLSDGGLWEPMFSDVTSWLEGEEDE